MLPHTPYQPPCHITWQGISIKVSYTPPWAETATYRIAHLEVRSVSPARHPLPFSETGDRPLFLPAGHVESEEDRPAADVLVWFEQSADPGRQLALI